MRRHTVGIIALLLLAIAGYGFARHGFEGGEISFFWNSCWRMGLVLGAMWLALPQLLNLTRNVSPWLLALLSLIGAFLVIRPRSIVFLGPVLLILALLQFFGWLVKPPPKKKSTRQHSRRRGN